MPSLRARLSHTKPLGDRGQGVLDQAVAGLTAASGIWAAVDMPGAGRVQTSVPAAQLSALDRQQP